MGLNGPHIRPDGLLLLDSQFASPGLRVEDEVNRCGNLTPMAEFLVCNCFYFCFYIWTIHVLNLVCTKQICFLNVIVHVLAEV
jgi:hypothetical protein